MPSPDLARYSLRSRVALTNGVTVAVVGLVAAVVATWFLSRLNSAAEDGRLRDLALVLHQDLEHAASSPRETVDDEATEVAALGVRITLFQGGVRKGGDPTLPDPATDDCFSSHDSESDWRTCALTSKSGKVVVSAPQKSIAATETILVSSIAAAALLAALAGMLTSGALARWALSPLTLLNARLASVSSAAPAKTDLGVPSGADEVEALRVTLRHLLDRLGTALDQSRDFAASAAHELRTPLALMRAELDLAAERSPAAAPAVARVRQTLVRLDRLVQSLLTLASEDSNFEDFREAVALEDLVRDAVSGHGDPQRARIVTECDSPGTVRGDEALLRSVIDNLLENALKFAPDGKVNVTVKESARDARVVVSDEGPGIDVSDWQRLLQPLQRGRAEVRGHGLGLAITAHVVRLHRGEMTLLPTDRGTSIQVKFPMWEAWTTPSGHAPVTEGQAT